MFFSGTGFSREEAGMNTMDFCGVASDAFPAKAGPTENAKAGLIDGLSQCLETGTTGLSRLPPM